VEVGVKGIWSNMQAIFAEIPQEDSGIQRLQQRYQRGAPQDVAMKVGEMVEAALQRKKEQEENAILTYLANSALDYKVNQPVGDSMFFNGAFMLSKARLREFEMLMEDLDTRYQDRANFKMITPLPLFSFVNITIRPEEWER
jgi:hypothetical protein